MADNKLFLLDAYALIFRAYYAFIKNPRITSYGLNTSAIYGFTNALLDILNNQKPSHIAVVFDHKSPNVRVQEHAFYKANRDETPEDIKLSEPYIRRLIEAFNIPVLEAEGYEADDVIGTLAKVAEKQGFTTYMMTPDKDFGQLVSENIKMFKPARSGGAHEVWGEEEVCEKFDLDNVNQIIDYLGLMGDAVDNIPGVPGVGPKTASKLLKQYGTMEGIYEHIDELKGKLKERLVDNKEQAFISRQLATILLDAPVPFEPEKLIKEEPNEDKLKELFTELEFRTMFKRVIGSEMQQTVKTGQQSLFDDFAPSAASSASKKKTTTLQTIETSPHEYGLIQLPIQREQLLKKLLKQDVVCFDTETTSLDVLDAEILGCAFSFEKGSGYYVTFPRDQQEAKEVLDEFLPFFQSDQIVKVLQNAKYDMHIFEELRYEFKRAHLRHHAGALFD
jgi:DNA polymerase-1